MRHDFDGTPLNGCRGCGEDFAGLTYFDRHRVGHHEYTLSGGLKLEPPREDGRRCLTVEELAALGLTLDKTGRWTDAAKSAQMRAAFAALDADCSLDEREISPSEAQDDESSVPGRHDAVRAL